nr:SWF or SNF family helicase [Streptomyces pathocidini]
MSGHWPERAVERNLERAMERTFDPLPPTRGRALAATWWGRAWLQALEDTALDGEQVRKGRRYAREGAVGAVSVRPGRITAVVRDRDGTPYRADVLLQELGDPDWDRLLDTVAGQAGHIAALLDREMPPDLVEDAAAAGVELLPGIGGLEPECACGEWDHCGHTAALCHQVARLLDQDPFVLLLLRGRGERELLADLQVRNAARSGGGSRGAVEDGVPGQEAEEGVSALEAFAGQTLVAPLPAPPPLPSEPGRPPLLGEAGRAPGLDVGALEFLAQDAAGRAWRMLAEALSPGHERMPVRAALTLREDAERLAAECSHERIRERLAEATAESPALHPAPQGPSPAAPGTHLGTCQDGGPARLL